jgi:HPt (histidine-containing phosphotransfer) domain-containing protein
MTAAQAIDPTARPIDSKAQTIDSKAIEFLRRLGGDRLTRDIVALYLTDAPVRVANARQLADSGDGDGVGRALHALRSSSGQVGAARVAALCEMGERMSVGPFTTALADLVAVIEREFDAAVTELTLIRDRTAVLD